MSDNTPQVFQRRAFTKDDGKGNSAAEWTLTPSRLPDPVQIIAEPIATLPIIFVPGIMGSNLRARVDVDGRKKGQAVWLMNAAGGALIAWYRATPAQRQARLNPANTEVTGEGEVPESVPSIGDAATIRKNRFWGEVSAMSYSDFLVWLQRTLNHSSRTTKWRAELGQPDFASHLAKGMTFKPMTEATVAHAADFRFPVYACGYNWLQSNLEAAATLAARIDKIIAANNSVSYHCEQVILVTHSMGGLVARACSELAGMRDKIAGVVHGVMPATGAAVAYKRVRSGTEGSAGLVIGDTAEKVTAVFANAPGALQLLPNQQYGNGWLKLGMGPGTRFKPAVSLPKADPYEEIYKQRGPWWALVREGLINPGNVDGHKGWTDYIKNINKAADFHSQLGVKYHPNTYTFHGNGTDQTTGLTWGTVGWPGYASKPIIDPSAAELLALKPLADNGEGKVSVAGSEGIRFHFSVSEKDSAGDGTVPVNSGAAPATAGVQATYHVNLDGAGHEGAYRVDMARRITLHAILTIAQTARVLK